MQLTLGTGLVTAGAGLSVLAGGGAGAALYAIEHPRDPYPDANIGLGIAALGGSGLALLAGVPALVGAQFLKGPVRGIASAAALAGVALGGLVAYTGFRNASEGH